jgi:transcriptional regulator with XRE-family HTH domain
MELIELAQNIKENRKKKGFTLETLARRAGVTKGYISQIENFRTVPSIHQLCNIAKALDIEPGALLKVNKKDVKYILTKRGEGPVIEREYPESGFIYKALAREKSEKAMEPFILEMPPHSQRKNVVTHGHEFFYLLEGTMDFFLANEKITMHEGDSLYFEGNIPHHPENNTDKKALLLVVYSIMQE